ncbi:hypothetical protein GJ496_006913 [Pomphorhynchus laevis]|nr:hypothetical protein GJ496_006913 [Pomphorhynchus laevis]
MKAQAQRDTSTTGCMTTKKNLDINPDHFIMKCLHTKDTGDKSMKDLVALLFESSLLASGFSQSGAPGELLERINRMIEFGLGIDDDADELLDGMHGKGVPAAVLADESDATRMEDVD